LSRLRLPGPQRAEELLPVVLTATIVAFTFGSSAFRPTLYLGRLFRWPLFLVLAFLALRWAAARVPRPRFPPALAGVTVAFVFLALVSFGWTVRPVLGLRAFALGIMFATASALAVGSTGRPDAARRLLEAMLAAAIVCAVVGVLLLPVPHGHAIQHATKAYPARFQGVGENPNTVPLLLAVTMPIALWLLLRARERRRRLLLAGVIVLFVAHIAAGSSRGALVGSLVGTVVLALFALTGWGRRAVAVVAAVAVAGAAFGAMTIPNAKSGPPKQPPAGTRDAQLVRPLEAEIGLPYPGRPRPRLKRSLLGSSGRGQAWRGAINQAVDRPLLGYGFGAEASVFSDRFYYFYSSTPENTFIGAFLQLGALGLALFVALVLTVLGLAARALRAPPPGEQEVVAVTAAIFTGAIVMAVTQTYLLAVGNLATVAVWICGFLAASRAAAVPNRQQR
jgi:O-antigen ligase